MNPLPISAEQSPLLFLELLYKLRVRDVMARNLVTIRRDAPMRELKTLMQERRVSGVPVVEDQRLFGIVSIEDLIQALEANRMDEPVAHFMAANVVTVEEDMPLSIVLSTFNKYEFRRFPVLNARQEAVGIVTARSINTRLLVELFQELARIENQFILPPAESATCYFKTFRIAKSDFENAGKTATEIKNVLQQRGIDPKIIRRVAIAAYELEMNLVVHSDGGTLTFRVDEGEVQLIAKDQGPGIADVTLAMQEGWTTANAWVKSLGFGAGMGLPNVQRVSDEFHIASAPGAGTTVTVRDILPARPLQNLPV
ncbi:MAG: CBS domain-containing protein [Opitutae bacterium]|nr:CBS domain-containing protein [Opitutae bacterium]